MPGRRSSNDLLRLSEAGSPLRRQAASLLACVDAGVFVVDAAGTIVFWNPAAEDITGVSGDSVQGRPAGQVLAGWSALSRRIPLAPATRERRRRADVRLELPGREVWVAISADESADGRVYTFSPLDEEQETEAAAGELLATLAHELRSPLAAIHGGSLALRSADLQLDEQTQRRLVEMIASEAARLMRLLSDLLSFSRFEADRLDLTIESCDARELASGVIEAARAHLPPQIALELSASEALPSVAADRDRLHQVLTNLVENAVKYSPEGGPVRVALERQHDRVRFSVRDEGLGVPVEDQPRVFEKFHRLDPKPALGIHGTGLGLYIARQLVHRMDGRIWIASREGEGSTFYFDLPISGTSPAVEHTPTQRAG